MKIDIVACYYRQAKYAPFFFWGMAENRDEIDKLIIVNDEPWDEEDLAQVLAAGDEAGIDTYCLDHPHAGPGTHGVATSMNQGVAYSRNEYVFLTSFDQILTPGTLSEITDFAAPETLILGRVDSIGSNTTLADLPTPKIIRPDIYSSWIPSMRENIPGRLVVGNWRNGHTLVHVPSHHKIGGFDERFVQLGYGFEDQDYSVRWLLEYGRQSIKWSDSSSWHFAGDKSSSLDPTKNNWNPEAVKIVNENLYRLYEKCESSPAERYYYQREETSA